MTASTMTVVVSDFHAGAAESLLTVLDENFHPDPGQTSPTTMALAAAFLPLMQELTKSGGKPDLVLLGDVLDLSLGKPDHAARIFSNFLHQRQKRRRKGHGRRAGLARIGMEIFVKHCQKALCGSGVKIRNNHRHRTGGHATPRFAS